MGSVARFKGVLLSRRGALEEDTRKGFLGCIALKSLGEHNVSLLLILCCVLNGICSCVALEAGWLSCSRPFEPLASAGVN